MKKERLYFLNKYTLKIDKDRDVRNIKNTLIFLFFILNTCFILSVIK